MSKESAITKLGLEILSKEMDRKKKGKEKPKPCYKCNGQMVLFPVYHDGPTIPCWVCSNKNK